MFKQIALIFALCSTSPTVFMYVPLVAASESSTRNERREAASKWKVKEKERVQS